MDGLAFAQQVSVFLASCRTASLATVGRGGQPCGANVQYVHDDDFVMYWVSSPTSQHSENLTADPRAAVTVYAHDDRAESIHGLQLRGSVAAVRAERNDAEWNRVWELYTEKFAFVASNPQLRAAVEQQRFYAFTPTWLRWIDNREAFGFKVEKSL